MRGRLVLRVLSALLAGAWVSGSRGRGEEEEDLSSRRFRVNERGQVLTALLERRKPGVVSEEAPALRSQNNFRSSGLERSDSLAEESPGALERFFNGLLNSPFVDRISATAVYFLGSPRDGAEKFIIRKANSVGLGLGALYHALRQLSSKDARRALLASVQTSPAVRTFVRRFGNCVEGGHSVRASLENLLSFRSDVARLALRGAVGRQEQRDFVVLLSQFRAEYFHILGFVALTLRQLMNSLNPLALFVERVMSPLQETLKSVAGFAGRFSGSRAGIARQQLLSWINHLSELDRAIVQIIPGAREGLDWAEASLTTVDETESSYGGREEEVDGLLSL